MRSKQEKVSPYGWAFRNVPEEKDRERSLSVPNKPTQAFPRGLCRAASVRGGNLGTSRLSLSVTWGPPFPHHPQHSTDNDIHNTSQTD